MNTDLNNMFNEEAPAATSNSRSLAGTAQLTNIAAGIAHDIMLTLNDNIETYSEQVAESKKDHSAMDKLVDDTWAYNAEEIAFIKELPDATIDGILKSQQSKRSRCKSKTMTMDNYKSMLTAAIAEKLVREATGKVKSSTGAHRSTAVVSFTGEQLAAFKEDQNKLRREIRNVQSKKSIAKSKADFDPTDERWLSLLEAEASLKELRSDVIHVDSTREALTTMLGTVDVGSLKSADAKKLLEQAMNLIRPQEETNE